MFLMTQDQLNRLGALRQHRYHEDLLRHAREAFAEHLAARTDAALMEITEKSVANARRVGVTSGNAVFRYVCLAIVINPEFDDLPEVRELFDAPGFDPDYKVHLLSDLLIAKLDRS